VRCKTAEKWISLALDGRLDGKSRALLDEHLRECPACREAEAGYRSTLALLRTGKEESPLPRFWERLEPRLREEQKLVPLVLWERLALHAIPAFAALVVLAAGLLFLTPQAQEMTQSETLLMENANPFSETKGLFEEKRPEAQSMMLMFASLDDKPAARRQLP